MSCEVSIQKSRQSDHKMQRHQAITNSCASYLEFSCSLLLFVFPFINSLFFPLPFTLLSPNCFWFYRQKINGSDGCNFEFLHSHHVKFLINFGQSPLNFWKQRCEKGDYNFSIFYYCVGCFHHICGGYQTNLPLHLM